MNEAQAIRRSFLARELAAAGGRFETRGDAAVAMLFDDIDEAAHLSRLAVADLSPLPRTGFKGPHTVSWLTGQGLELPERPNLARRQDDGTCVARLGTQEHLILPSLSGDGALIDRLDGDCESDDSAGIYRLPRRDSHAWLRIAGIDADACFAKLCAVDLGVTTFANFAVAQTMFAGISAIVIRDDLPEVPAYHLLFDSASAGYLWGCLFDAGTEFEIAPIGFAALAAAAGL